MSELLVAIVAGCVAVQHLLVLFPAASIYIAVCSGIIAIVDMVWSKSSQLVFRYDKYNEASRVGNGTFSTRLQYSVHQSIVITSLLLPAQRFISTSSATFQPIADIDL